MSKPVPNQTTQATTRNRAGALPAGGATAYSAPIRAEDVPDVDKIIFFVDVPALTTTQLPNAQTYTFSLVEGNDPTFATGVVSTTPMGTATGASGKGSAAFTAACRPATVGGNYIGVKAVGSASANASGVAFALGVAKT